MPEADEPGVLIDKARRELAALFPWVNFGRMEWITIKLDRRSEDAEAEGEE